MLLDYKSTKNFRNRLHAIYIAACCAITLIYPADTFSASNKNFSCTDSGPIIFGILPFVSAEQLVARFTPLANYLSTNLNTAVRIETAPDFTKFARRTDEDKRYDILFTAPHFFPQAHYKAGYRLIAGVDSPGMRVVIVVPRKSNIHSVEDLRGRRMATIDPAGLATLMIKKYLSDSGIDPDTDITLINTPSHNASLLSAYHGITDASALMQPPYEASSTNIKNHMRIIAKTERAPHIPISASPRLSEDCIAEISDLMLKMHTTEAGKKVLIHNRFSGFKTTTLEQYNKIKERLNWK